MPKYTITIEVTETEHANFLQRLSGADGRKIDVSTAETTSAEAPTTDATTDKNGIAWNEKYHSSSKALNADGTWRLRKGMSDTEKAEAAALTGAPTVPAAVAAPTPSVPDVPSSTMPGLPVAEPVALPGLPVATPEPTPVSYADLVAMFQTLKPEVAANFGALYVEAGVTDPNALKEDGALRIALAAVIKKHNG
jgi:hypothetical protein